VFFGQRATRIRLTRMLRVLAALAAAVVEACHSDGRGPERRDGSNSTEVRDSTIELKDDAGRSVRLVGPALRVISLIPSATETLIALGATENIVGRTRYDVAPEVAGVPSVGGGIDPSVEAVVRLHPDLVLAWDNDKRQEVQKKLMALGVAVFTLRTEDTSDLFRGITNIGRLTGRDSAARALAASIRQQFDDVRRSVAGRQSPRVFYVVFNDPPMTAGPATFIGQLISLAGGRSIFADTRQLWPSVSMEEIVLRDPDLLVVPTGEFRTNSVERFRGRPGWRDLRAVREGHVVTVSANLMSRPGPNIGKAARALRAAFYQEFASAIDSSGALQRPVSQSVRR
jgi:iron complex transport system substrate-binding protein